MPGSSAGFSLETLQTPALIIDEGKMNANIARMHQAVRAAGASFRAHLKTAKSIDVARRTMTSPAGPATVSTLFEAERFSDAGVMDITYAVGITPEKLPRVTALRQRGIDLSIIVDSLDAAKAVAAHGRATGDHVPTLIEIDCDGHRAGLTANEIDKVLEIGRVLHAEGATLSGVLTHAGESYSARSDGELRAAADQERDAVVRCASALRVVGLPAPVVSVGSTPTALFARDLTGVTEVRAGVFVFFDLVMAGIGICRVDEIALSVLATVIGTRPEKGWILVDAGWMALSRDRGTASQRVDQGYGVVLNVDGTGYPDLIVSEQGILALRKGSRERLPDLRLGDRIRILPNHACATAAQHGRYHVLSQGDSTRIAHVWDRFSGW
jgi:D-serine deaminase-like pyridoxal phosphate-dependent protein